MPDTLDSTTVDKDPKIMEPVMNQSEDNIDIECGVCYESAANLYRKI
jgi:hypothetical protein